MFFIGVGATIAAECIALVVSAIIRFGRQKRNMNYIDRSDMGR